MSKKSHIKQPESELGKSIRPPNLILGEDLSDDDRHPHFSFQYLQSSHCIAQCEKDEKAALADQLRILGSLPWKAIRQASRQGIGYEKIKKSSIKVGIPRIVTEDTDYLIAFRFSGKKPMVGHKVKNVFFVMWLDRNFTLYKHGR